MGRCEPPESHMVATPLELLFDLTYATSFSLAAAQLAHALAEGHYAVSVLGFGLASFAICWAWINFSWFSSAYDTDDWIFRVVTMVQMIGVLVLAIGLPRMFASIEHGERLDNSVMVLGYVIMRVALVFQWLRAARVGGADLCRSPDRGDGQPDRCPGAHRAGGAPHRRTSGRRHTLARASHRRAP